jgi:hypothetical protein
MTTKTTTPKPERIRWRREISPTLTLLKMKVVTIVHRLVASQHEQWVKAVEAKKGLSARIPGLHIYALALLKKNESLDSCLYGGSEEFADLYLDDAEIERQLGEDWDFDSATFKGLESYGVVIVVIPDTHAAALAAIFDVKYDVLVSESDGPPGEVSERSTRSSGEDSIGALPSASSAPRHMEA